jgi:lactate dehydrogenase-like 2-hydroxyacid dehydrogenase
VAVDKPVGVGWPRSRSTPYSDRMVSTDELTSVAHRCDYIFAMHETMISAEVVAGTPRLKGIVVGGRDASDMIDIDACEAAGIQLVHAPSTAKATAGSG